MPGEVKPDRGQFLIQPLLGRKGFRFRQVRPLQLHLAAPAAKQAGLGAFALLRRELGHRQQDFRRRNNPGPVGINSVKRPGLGQVLKCPAVDLPWIDPLGKVIKILERTLGLSFCNDVFHRGEAHIADRTQRKPHTAFLDREISV